MYNEPLFLKPVFQDRIWGGTALRTKFNYDIPSEQTGECWGISAHPNGPCEILNGRLKGKTLDQVWNSNRELFANQEGEEFPLLVKILDANDDLSVQVHPNNEQAVELENYPFGKTECWYIIECEEYAEIIYGHHAKSKEEFESMVELGKWHDLLRSMKVKAGDFVYVPSGTIHAIGNGIQILETQQSSDITYRVYDYDRRDAEGNTRELHIDKSIAVATSPHQDSTFITTETLNGGLTSKKLIEEMYFTVYHWNLDGTVTFQEDDKYLLVSVLKGEGDFIVDDQSYSFKKGDHFIIPSTLKEYKFVGNAEFIVSHTTK